MPTAPSPTELRARFSPVFDSETVYPDTLIVELGAEAEAFPAVSDRALLYLTAHLLTMENESRPSRKDAAAGIVRPDGGAGLVQQEYVAGRRVIYEFQAKNPDEAFFKSSTYGRRYWALQEYTAGGTGGLSVNLFG